MALADKVADPRYQNFESDDLPEEQHEGSTVKVLAGEGSPTVLYSDMTYLDVRADAGVAFARDLPTEWQGFLYVLKGDASFGANGQHADAGKLLVLGKGSGLQATAGDDGVRFMLAAGQPHCEPVRWRGPYVD